jgi:hypothetical protein
MSVVASGGLVASRNRAIDDAMLSGKPCVQLSDDLGTIYRKLVDNQTADYTCAEAADEILRAMRAIGARLGGCSPTANPFFSQSPLKTAHFVVADFIVIDSCTDLRFDPQFFLKEDYDYTCQHLQRCVLFCFYT